MGLKPKFASLFLSMASLSDFAVCFSTPSQDLGFLSSLFLHTPFTHNTHCLYYNYAYAPLLTLLNSSF